MQANEYQESIKRFAIYPGSNSGDDREITYLTLGLLSEAGEVAGKWKKYIRDNAFVRDIFIAEIGDCFWYLSQLCSSQSITIEEVMQRNFDKLSKRKDAGTISGNGDER